jgi:hypothetical protein
VRARVIIARLLQGIGTACLIIVLFTHVAERFRIFPAMGWGLPDSPGHYLDLVSAILAVTILPLGFAKEALMRRRKAT